MMPLRRFTIHQPKNHAEASQMLAQFGEKGRVYAGGTELLLAMKHDLLRYEHLVDVKTIPGLDKIETKNGSLFIGGGGSHRGIQRSSHASAHSGTDEIATRGLRKISNPRTAHARDCTRARRG